MKRSMALALFAALGFKGFANKTNDFLAEKLNKLNTLANINNPLADDQMESVKAKVLKFNAEKKVINVIDDEAQSAAAQAPAAAAPAPAAAPATPPAAEGVTATAPAADAPPAAEKPKRGRKPKAEGTAPAEAPAPAAPKDPNILRTYRGRLRLAAAGKVLKDHGIEAYASNGQKLHFTKQMVEEVNALSDKPNDNESLADLANAASAIMGYLGKLPEKSEKTPETAAA